ncbi:MULTISPECIES: phage tail tape measure protein [unclassified Pseudomonas]|uniref:phage tail tape measure protein n=1 Tax=unclassified Pseudomonas TaxID=196821 RepID=UPI001F33C43A|nr:MULTISPECIES: phage tail tape measure protein [unclassified Pseudomonas]MCF5231385.1 phage tail tape measure protein [Pseudomonas sp. PA-5-4H]MCF5238104.1 phage tail tape measure protein [Pseudomonas sp. PA-5-4G]MCF5245963.1 phage tail tape measure protein [Pseudomonas sp. PA-5-4B]MCF5252709.1 phage tail tape measure protein [Pseudomonas sp. PA-5-4B]MCF5257945.1 phage tail tape measure protein [Pseudomonas sp. PA-5-4A]
MQNKYSLAYAMAKDGQGVFGSADGANDASLVNPGTLAPPVPESATEIGLALANADLRLNELAQSLQVLRESVDALETSLSTLKTADVQPLKSEEHSESKTVAEFTSTRSEDLRLTRESMSLGAGQPLDPVAAQRYSNAHLSFDTKATSEKSITVLRKETTESASRLTKTLEPAPILGEATWLQAKTEVMDKANDLAGDSPLGAKTVKTAEAVISGLAETVTSRFKGNVVDVTLGKIPLIGKFFQDGGFEKDKSCCCATAGEKSISSRDSARGGSSGRQKSRKPKSQPAKKSQPARKAQTTQKSRPARKAQTTQKSQPARKSQTTQKSHPERKAQTTQTSQTSHKKQTPAAKPSAAKRSLVKGGGLVASLYGVGERLSRWFPQQQSLGFAGATSPGLQPPVVRTNSRNKKTAYQRMSSGSAPGLLEALERGLAPMPFEGRRDALPHAQPTSRERLPAPAYSSLKMPASGVWSTMSKLESSAVRRLGPLKYVDTAMDVVQGVRNGDAKAVGAGLTTAGGAWAGASAGAAIGTLIFPGVGTAVGGAIGGLLGSEAGTWLGEKLFSANDRLPAPGAVSKELNAARTDNVQVTLAPSIQITGVNPADAQQVVNQVIQALQFQCMPMVTDSLGIRRNAALADPSGGD